MGERYPDFTPLYAAEKLWEQHKANFLSLKDDNLQMRLIPLK
jgi:hypothetical protein